MDGIAALLLRPNVFRDARHYPRLKEMFGIRNADRKPVGHRALARAGRFTGYVGAIIALIAVIVFTLVKAAHGL